MRRRTLAQLLAAGGVLLCSLAPSAPAAGTDAPPPLQLSAWLPHWKKAAGAARFREHAGRFASISPFAFRVQSAGRIADTPRIGQAPWPALRALASEHGVQVLPSVVWADRQERARTLADPALRARHVDALLALVERHGFDGLDLDYERKLPSERAPFSRFVEALSRQLHTRGKSLACTIEPRASPQPPKGTRGRRASPWVDDYAVLAAACDAVRIMAYDQWAIASAGFEGPQHASVRWVRAVLAHAVQVLPREKLHLGIPTYGWELGVPGARAEKRRALSFRQFGAEVKRLGLTPVREDGQLIARSGERTLVVADATTIATLEALARGAGIAGIVLFKLDGETDPAFWRR